MRNIIKYNFNSRLQKYKQKNIILKKYAEEVRTQNLAINIISVIHL